MDNEKKHVDEEDDIKHVQSGGNKEEIVEASKKSQPMGMFVSVAGNLTDREVGRITKYWATCLEDKNIELESKILGEGKVVFIINDGSLAIQVKDFLVAQDNCESVSFDNQEFPGKGKK